MIVVLGGIKGGCGKTTICTNLAVHRTLKGKKVLLIDSDEQRSTYDWILHRENHMITTRWTSIILTGTSMYKQVSKMKDDYDDIIIDTGWGNTTSQRASMIVADKYLVPVLPRSLDLWTLDDVCKMIEEMKTANPKMDCYICINKADFSGTDNAESAKIIKEKVGDNATLVPTYIVQRKAFSNAISLGMGVLELRGEYYDEKACKEFLDLSEYIFDTK